MCVCSFSSGSVPKFSTQPAINKSIGTDDLDIIFGVGWRFLVDIFSKNKKVFPALQATFSFRLQFHSLLGSVGGLSRDKLLLSCPSLQSFLWNLLKSSRHVTSRNQGLSPRRQGRKRREGLGTRLTFHLIYSRLHFLCYKQVDFKRFAAILKDYEDYSTDATTSADRLVLLPSAFSDVKIFEVSLWGFLLWSSKQSKV